MAFDFSLLTSASPMQPIAVAEMGTAHGGDLARGLDLVDAAADAGADIAKVQVVFAQEILPPEAGLVPLPGGDTPLYEVFKDLERPAEFYAALAQRAENRGMGFLATPFGEKSVRLLEEIGVAAWKVASPELNYEPLLDRLARTGLPIVLSTGISHLEDIERALAILEGAWPSKPKCRETDFESNTDSRKSRFNNAESLESKAEAVLLHCLTSYPAPENEANLKLIWSLRNIFGRPTGLSDHSLDPVFLPVLGAALGAVMVEKHITLDRRAGGLDDKVALNPKDFSKMTSAMKDIYAEVQKPKGLDGALDHIIREYGRKRVEAALGDGIKRLASSEEAHYNRTNRSLHAVGALAAGTLLTPENTALLRTEKVLSPGLPPRDRHRAYRRRLIRDIAPGEGINWDDIGL